MQRTGIKLQWFFIIIFLFFYGCVLIAVFRYNQPVKFDDISQYVGKLSSYIIEPNVLRLVTIPVLSCLQIVSVPSYSLNEYLRLGYRRCFFHRIRILIRTVFLLLVVNSLMLICWLILMDKAIIFSIILIYTVQLYHICMLFGLFQILVEYLLKYKVLALMLTVIIGLNLVELLISPRSESWFLLQNYDLLHISTYLSQSLCLSVLMSWVIYQGYRLRIWC